MIPASKPTFTGSAPGSPAWLILTPGKPDGPPPPFPATAKARRAEYLAQGRLILRQAADSIGRLGRPALRRVVDLSTGFFRGLASGLVRGVTTLAGWFTRALPNLIYRHYAGTLALTGGETPPADVLDELDGEIDDQAGLLARFRGAIASGAVATGKAIVSRAGSYGSAIWATAVNAFRRMMGKLRRLERRILGDVEAHCHECPYLAALGWRPVGSLPPIGATVCREGCRCSFEYA